MIYCVFHSRDLDGWCSAAIMKKKFHNATMIGYDYGETFGLFKTIQSNDEVYMADVSLPMENMFILSNMVNGKLTYIDHHKSAMNDYEEFRNKQDISKKNFLTPVLDNSISACEGTWKYLFQDKQIPRAVTLLGEYDTWRNKDKEHWESTVLPFQYGMRARCNSVETFPIYLLDDENRDEDINQIIHEGKIVLAFQDKLNESLCKRAFEHKFEGYTAICLNTPVASSDTFKSIYNPNKHDVMMPFYFDGKTDKWIVSIYTTKNIDCSVLAEKYGGGGHPKACGMQVDDIKTILPKIT